jgi:hypothetical protein
MAVERIDLSIGVEQTFTLNCNDVIYRFDLRYDEYNEKWYIDIYDNETEDVIFSGLYLLINNNAFRYLDYFDIGSGLGLYDTEPDNEDAIVKADLGNRVKMYREVS